MMMAINTITIGMSCMSNKLKILGILIGIAISLIVASNSALSITPTVAAKASSLTPWQLFLIICPYSSPQSPQCPILLQQTLPFYQQQQNNYCSYIFSRYCWPSMSIWLSSKSRWGIMLYKLLS